MELPLTPPKLTRSFAQMNVYSKPTTGLCNICNCCVKLQFCRDCNMNFLCNFCLKHYERCSDCVSTTIIFNDYFSDKIDHYQKLQFVNKQIKTLSSAQPPALFNHNFSVLYNRIRVDRIIWAHKYLFGNREAFK
jgi:hypothetical protein